VPIRTIPIGDDLVQRLGPAIEAALEYERATGGRRNLGITGEVGELLCCHRLGLELALDPRSEGFDAVDKEGLRVQIKTRRNESTGLPRDRGRTGRFSHHEFDYALLVILDHDYQLREVWRAAYEVLKPLIERQKRRNPSLLSFKRAGTKIYPVTVEPQGELLGQELPR